MGDHDENRLGGGARAGINGPARTLERARKLRQDMSLPEVVLWRELGKRPGGLKFRRQYPAGDYVLDFYCAAARLAIEVDGWGHDNVRTAQADATRSHFLRSQRIATLRVPAKAVLDELEGAVARITEVCEQRMARLSGSPREPLHHASHGPPPRSGEDS